MGAEILAPYIHLGFIYFAGMKSSLFTGFFFLQFFCACGSNEAPDPAADDLGTASGFIRSALDGDYDQARTLIMPDSVNIQYLDAFERNYKGRMTSEDKKGYRDASINIHNIVKVSDSVTVVRYSNSFKREADSLKIVQQGGKWFVDLKYSFSPNEAMQ